MRIVRHVLQRVSPVSVPAVLLAASLAAAAAPAPEQVPSRPPVDSPELAFPGPHAVGVETLKVVDPAQVDPIESTKAGRIVSAPRTLPLTVWYPAKPGGRPTPYTASLTSEPPRPPAVFHIRAMAVKDAPPDGTGYPLVLLSHGYNNDPAMLSWLTENLATKGYVVVGIHHDDPPITDRPPILAALLRRPLDIAYVLRSLRGGLLGKLADTTRIALVGYSMGSHGVLTSAGAELDPTSPMLEHMSKELVARYAAGGSEAAALRGGDIKAVVAIAPPGGAPWYTWRKGVEKITVPMLIVAGEADRKVGYRDGPLAIFQQALNADRYLLVFHGAGHNLGVDPVPSEMRARLWDFDWFADPIWRKDRLNAISVHFITAFLDLNVKGDASRAAYLETSTEESNEAKWEGPATPYDAVSEGGKNPAWKGFRRDHQDGLILRHLAAGAR
jgi:predicted dienelactone hydrolase